MACDYKHEMLQIELYVLNLDRTCALLTSVFGLKVIEEKPGWRHLRHSANYDIMLFAPTRNQNGGQWALPMAGTGGKGIEIVLCTLDVSGKLKRVREFGYECTNLQYPPWGSVEFIFHLDEGYLLRIKQPAHLRSEEVDRGKTVLPGKC
jgi:catechol 2,3-dioxygenase-like lactoylglutathione lyase family enzyme